MRMHDCPSSFRVANLNAKSASTTGEIANIALGFLDKRWEIPLITMFKE